MTDSDPGDMKLGLEVLKGFSGKLLQAGLGFAGTVIFSRALGPSDFGGYYLLLSLVMIANRPIMGIATATKKRFAERDADREEIFGAQALLNGALFVAAILVAVVFRGELAAYTGLETASLLFVVLFGSITTFAPLQQLIEGSGKISTPVWIDTLRSALTFPLQLAFVLLGFGAAGMAYGLSGATLLCLPISLYVLRTRPSVPGMGTLRSVWQFARYSIGSRLVGRAYDELDPVILGFILTPATVGYYQVAYKLTVPGMFVTVIASSGLLTKVSNLDTKGQGVREDVTNAVAFGSILAIPMFFGALAIPERLIITVYEAEYAEAAVLLVGLTLFTIVRTQSNLLADVLNGLDHPSFVFRASALALVLNLAIGIPATIVYGPIGVVVATIVAEACRYGIFFVVVRRETGARLLPRPILEQIVAGATMYGVIEALHPAYVAITSWAVLLSLLGVGAFVYFGVLAAISRFLRVTVRAVLGDALAG